MLDEYLLGGGTRICREAPVPQIGVSERHAVPGGAGNVAANLAALGADVTFLSVLGDDRDGQALGAALERAGVGVAEVLVEPGRATIAKRRLVVQAYGGDVRILPYLEGRGEDRSTDALIRRIRAGDGPALGVTLAGLTAQTMPRFRVVVSDQSEHAAPFTAGEVQTAVRLLRARGRPVELRHHVPRRGQAEHRQFLLDQARGRYALFLDDDVLLEPEVLDRLLRVIREQGCGFVGAPLIGLSHLDDVRPDQQAIEPWDGPVRPERVTPGSAAWARHHLHSAANAWHVTERLALTGDDPFVYKVAWVGGCVLYEVDALREVGGFGFWTQLPVDHCGEDVLAQLRVMDRFGGCGVLPSGAYHQQLPTTVPDRTVDAPTLLRGAVRT